MDKATKNAIENDPYPIQVTKALIKPELRGWERHLQKRGIEYILKPVGDDKYILLRKLTPEEIKECMEGEWFISGKTFKSAVQVEKTKPDEK